MSHSAVLTSVRRLRSLLAAQHGHEQSDEQLLTAFAESRDEIAFAALVRRHGPMVLGVCRRVLGHEQDAEDAFQATFLVLARRAVSLRSKSSLASFLYGTAYHLASKAKRAAGRRRKHEGQASARPPVDPADDLSWREVRALLDEEIARLPERSRSVFVLCCLEKLSQAETGRRLGLKEGTVANRLAEARKRLSQRLARRGVELTTVLAASTLAAQSASALPAALMESTLKAALATAAGGELAGVVSASVVELVKSMTAPMMGSIAKITTALLAVGMLAGASVWTYRGLAPNTLPSSEQSAKPPDVKSDDKAKAARPGHDAAKGMEIQGRVLDPEGKPKAGAKLLLLSHGANRKITQLGVSATDGRFTVVVPQGKEDEWIPSLIGQAEGAGIAFDNLYEWKSGKPIELRLVKDRVIRGRIVSTEGKPVAGVRITLENIGICDKKSMDTVLDISKKWPNSLFWQPSGVTLMAPPVIFRREGDALLAATTDADGRFVLHGLGDERFVALRLSGKGIADEELWIVNRKGFDPEAYHRAMLDNIPKGMINDVTPRKPYGSDVTFIAENEKVIRGIVKDADSGKVLPNIVIHLTHGERKLVNVHLQATTNAEGRYEIHGAHKAKSYTLVVDEDATVGYVPCRVGLEDTVGYQPVTKDIKVKKGVIITGKMIDGETGKPLPGFVSAAVLAGNPFVKDFPNFNFTPGHARGTIPTHSGADGIFRVVAVPGPVLLMAQTGFEEFKFRTAEPDPNPSQYFRIDKNPAFSGYYNADGSIGLLLRNYWKVLQIKPDAKIVKQDIVLERAPSLPVQIQDADGKPLRGVWAAGGTAHNSYPAIQCMEAECKVYQLEAGKPRVMVFLHRERKLAGTLTLKGDEKAPLVAKLGQAGSIKGRLIDADGKPRAGVVVEVHYRHPAASNVQSVIRQSKQVVSNAEGAFAFDDLIPQQKFDLWFRQSRGDYFERAATPADPAIEVKPGERQDLGAIELKWISNNPGK